jgi:hypothetical protein
MAGAGGIEPHAARNSTPLAGYVQEAVVAPVLAISGQDVGRIGGFAGGQLLGKPFVPGIAKRGHVNDSP